MATTKPRRAPKVRSANPLHPTASVTPELLERTVMLLREDTGFAEVVYVASSPELARAFVIGFNMRAKWDDVLKEAEADIADNVLKNMLESARLAHRERASKETEGITEARRRQLGGRVGFDETAWGHRQIA